MKKETHEINIIGKGKKAKMVYSSLFDLAFLITNQIGLE